MTTPSKSVQRPLPPTPLPFKPLTVDFTAPVRTCPLCLVSSSVMGSAHARTFTGLALPEVINHLGTMKPSSSLELRHVVGSLWAPGTSQCLPNYMPPKDAEIKCKRAQDGCEAIWCFCQREKWQQTNHAIIRLLVNLDAINFIYHRDLNKISRLEGNFFFVREILSVSDF
jgi:hypothetical protein